MRSYFLKLIPLVLLLCGCGCASQPRKECNLELLRQRHPELQEALKDYPSLIMDMMKTIATLEEEAGHYQ